MAHEDDEEERVWAAATKRAQDPEWNRRWFDEVFPAFLRVAEEHWASLTPEQRVEWMSRQSSLHGAV